MFLWKVLWNPQDYALAIVEHPPLGAVTLWLMILAAFWVLIVEALHTKAGAQRNLTGFRSALIGVPPMLLAVGLLLTFLTLGMMRWIGHPLSFEALFCLLAFALAPKYVHWMGFPLREISRPALYIWRTLSAVFLLAIAVRLWETFRAAAHLPGWQTLLAIAPALASLLAVSLMEIFLKPTTLRAAYSWRRARGKRVVVFYPPGKAAADAEAMAKESDALVGQIEQFLEVRPLAFRIEVFLFESPEDMRRLLQVKHRLAHGYAYNDHIGLLYDSWSEIKDTVAHEITHTVVMQRLHKHLMPLLNEGLAEYGETQTGGSATASICIPLSLSTLAHPGVFYDWQEIEAPDYSPGAKYAHAAALVDYLIGRYGMNKFKELCLQTAYDSQQNRAAQFHKAVVEIYGISLQNLEIDWRREWIGSGQIEFALDLPDAR